ncbi:hypothetical protein BGX38DRAFT_1270850 [Terfezia claveryi]|nr:hypothetical protein BGX38DRAFT_1270850 [Terfezia claveryi]
MNQGRRHERDKTARKQFHEESRSLPVSTGLAAVGRRGKDIEHGPSCKQSFQYSGNSKLMGELTGGAGAVARVVSPLPVRSPAMVEPALLKTPTTKPAAQLPSLPAVPTEGLHPALSPLPLTTIPCQKPKDTAMSNSISTYNKGLVGASLQTGNTSEQRAALGNIKDWEDLNRPIWVKEEDGDDWNAVEAFFGFLYTHMVGSG